MFLPGEFIWLMNYMDRRVWQALVHEVAKSWTQLKWLTHTQSFIMKSFNQFPHACYFMEPWTNKVMMHLTTGKEVFSVFSAVRFSFGQCFNLHRLPSQIPQTGVLNNISFFLSFGGWKSKIKALAYSVPNESSLSACRQPPSPVFLQCMHLERKKDPFFFLKGR